jgi:hypothetical protein
MGKEIIATFAKENYDKMYWLEITDDNISSIFEQLLKNE